MFTKIKLKYHERKMDKKLKLFQLHCSHNYVYYGKTYESNNHGGYIDVDEFHIAKCTSCFKEVKYSNKSDADNLINFCNKYKSTCSDKY